MWLAAHLVAGGRWGPQAWSTTCTAVQPADDTRLPCLLSHEGSGRGIGHLLC
jgi:hypothetical protein